MAEHLQRECTAPSVHEEKQREQFSAAAKQEKQIMRDDEDPKQGRQAHEYEAVHKVPIIRSQLALLSNSDTQEEAFHNLQHIVCQMDSNSVPRFLSSLHSDLYLGSSPIKTHFAVSLYLDCAREHGPRLIPHLPRVMANLTRWLRSTTNLARSTAPQVSEACCRVVLELARIPTATDEAMAQNLEVICSALLAVLGNTGSGSCTSWAAIDGAAVCLKALVDSHDVWQCAKQHTVEEVCLRMVSVLEREKCYPAPLLGLAASLARGNPLVCNRFAPTLIHIAKFTLHQEQGPEPATWQQRLASAKLLRNLFDHADDATAATEASSALAVLEASFHRETNPYVQDAISSAMHSARAISEALRMTLPRVTDANSPSVLSQLGSPPLSPEKWSPSYMFAESSQPESPPHLSTSPIYSPESNQTNISLPDDPQRIGEISLISSTRIPRAPWTPPASAGGSCGVGGSVGRPRPRADGTQIPLPRGMSLPSTPVSSNRDRVTRSLFRALQTEEALTPQSSADQTTPSPDSTSTSPDVLQTTDMNRQQLEPNKSMSKRLTVPGSENLEGPIQRRLGPRKGGKGVFKRGTRNAPPELEEKQAAGGKSPRAKSKSKSTITPNEALIPGTTPRSLLRSLQSASPPSTPIEVQSTGASRIKTRLGLKKSCLSKGFEASPLVGSAGSSPVRWESPSGSEKEGPIIERVIEGAAQVLEDEVSMLVCLGDDEMSDPEEFLADGKDVEMAFQEAGLFSPETVKSWSVHDNPIASEPSQEDGEEDESCQDQMSENAVLMSASESQSQDLGNKVEEPEQVAECREGSHVQNDRESLLSTHSSDATGRSLPGQQQSVQEPKSREPEVQTEIVQEQEVKCEPEKKLVPEKSAVVDAKVLKQMLENLAESISIVGTEEGKVERWLRERTSCYSSLQEDSKSCIEQESEEGDDEVEDVAPAGFLGRSVHALSKVAEGVMKACVVGIVGGYAVAMAAWLLSPSPLYYGMLPT